MAGKGSFTPYHGVGRRKSSVSRVWMKPGKGEMTINGKALEDYFPLEKSQREVMAPFAVTASPTAFDVKVNVNGGGTTGQAQATGLALSRAILVSDERHRAMLRERGLLTVDSRIVERKKYGQKGARAKFQFVKR